MLPTVASITGAKTPQVVLDGMDMSPFLFEDKASKRDHYIWISVQAMATFLVEVSLVFFPPNGKDATFRVRIFWVIDVVVPFACLVLEEECVTYPFRQEQLEVFLHQ